jgi:ubiquinone/menaquinone biosynthesis C-methylase UbiE
MLAVARAWTSAAVPIQWHDGRAENTRLATSSYDVVLCQMGLQFFADQPAAVREMWRLLAEDGRLVLNVPGPTPAIFAILERALQQHVSPDAAHFVRAVFSLHDARALRNLVEGAGFEHVSVHVSTKRLRLSAPAAFLWQYVSSTPLAGIVSQISSEGRSHLQEHVVAA